MTLNANSRNFEDTPRTKLNNYNKKNFENFEKYKLPEMMILHPTKGRKYMSRKRIVVRAAMQEKYGFIR